MFIVVVRITTKPGAEQAFREAILENAAESRKEPGCHQFDVSVSEDARTFFLYEVYQDRSSWDVSHHGSLHFQKFARISGPLIERKELELFERIAPREKADS